MIFAGRGREVCSLLSLLILLRVLLCYKHLDWPHWFHDECLLACKMWTHCRTVCKLAYKQSYNVFTFCRPTNIHHEINEASQDVCNTVRHAAKSAAIAGNKLPSLCLQISWTFRTFIPCRLLGSTLSPDFFTAKRNCLLKSWYFDHTQK